MKTCRIYLIIASVIVISNSCKNNSKNNLEYIEPAFDEVINMDVKVLNGSFVFSNGQISVVDTLIIYGGMTNISNKAFHLFSKNTGKYITSFGNIGRAKAEISSAYNRFSIDKERRMMYVYDLNRAKVVCFSLDKVLLGDNDYAHDIMLPKIVNKTVSNQFIYLKNSFLVGHTSSGRFLVCSESDSITCNDFYPSLDEPQEFKNVERQYFFYMGCMAARPDGNLFVYATRSGCIMEIWKNHEKTISPYIIKGLFKPEYNSRYREMPAPLVTIKEDAPHGISMLTCSNQHIYAIYNDLPGYISNKIAVFDWNGKPQKIYIVNKDLGGFDVDEDNNIYALALSDDNIELVTIHSN